MTTLPGAYVLLKAMRSGEMGSIEGLGPPSRTVGAGSDAVGGSRDRPSQGAGLSLGGATYPGWFQGNQSMRSCANAVCTPPKSAAKATKSRSIENNPHLCDGLCALMLRVEGLTRAGWQGCNGAACLPSTSKRMRNLQRLRYVRGGDCRMTAQGLGLSLLCRFSPTLWDYRSLRIEMGTYEAKVSPASANITCGLVV
jgi:hypothetical protein